MVVTSNTNSPPTTTMATSTNGTSNETSPSGTHPPVPNGNMSTDSQPPPSVSPKTYQLLLQQVQNLRMENNTLKAELKNNTSHISKLENEASSLKDMVYMLGISGGGEVESINGNNATNNVRTRTGFTADENRLPETSASSKAYPSLPYMSPMKLSGEQDLKKYRPELPLPLGVTYQPAIPTSLPNFRPDHLPHLPNGLHGSVSPPPSSAVADAIKKHIFSLKKDRANILRKFQLEEQKKDYYMKQLKELNYRLDNVSDSDKFTKPNDKTRQQLELEIANLQKTMEQTLGTSEVMEGRLQAWLNQIQDIEKEIHVLGHCLLKLETTPLSPELQGFSDLSPYLDSGADQGSCTKHTSFLHGAVSFSEISTQTPKSDRAFEEIIYEEEFSSCDNWNLDAQISAGSGRVSRPVQTIASCLAGRGVQNHPYPAAAFEMQGGTLAQHDPLGSRSEHKPPGSVESLSQSDIDDTASMHSFTTSLPRQFQTNNLGTKKDGVHSPSSLLSTSNKEDICRRFRHTSKTVDGCFTLRRTGCVPVIVKIIHDGGLLNLPPSWTFVGPGRISATASVAMKAAREMRIGMALALRNIVHTTSDITRPNLEAQILNQLEVIRGYCEQLYELWVYVQTLQSGENEDGKERRKNHTNFSGNHENGKESNADTTKDSVQLPAAESLDFRTGLLVLYKPPMASISTIMKLSINETSRGIINELGGLYAVAELFILHCQCAGSTEQVCAAIGNDAPRPDKRILDQLLSLRRYVGFALINLTYGDMANKSILIQMPRLVDMVMARIETESEEMQQVLARFLRNLSWQPDEKCSDILRQKSVVTVLMKCALQSKREVTLKSILSALWNLSGHCPENRTSICAVKGALAFIVSTLTYRNQSKSPAIIESGGGILRNVSSVVATSEEYRQILRENNCLQILVSHLKASSLTIVSNACGTLWNLSARNAKDQKQLWELGAVNMLRNLVHSKHSMIAQGSNGALRNLLANRPENMTSPTGRDSEKNEGEIARKLQTRKQKIMEAVVHPGTTPDLPENFSPRHHAWSNGPRDKVGSPRSTLSPQRRSLQETSSSSPAPELDKSGRFRKPGLHYSGSLGNISNTDFGDTFSKSLGNTKYVAAARNSNSYPDSYSSSGHSGGFGSRAPVDMGYGGQGRPTLPSGFTSLGGAMKDVMIFNDTTKSPSPQGPQVPKVKLDDPSNVNKNTPQNKLPLQLLQYLRMRPGVKMPQSGGTTATMPQQQMQYGALSVGMGPVQNVLGNQGYIDPTTGALHMGGMPRNPQHSDMKGFHNPYLQNGPLPNSSWAGPGTLSQSTGVPSDYTQMPSIRNHQVMGLPKIARNNQMGTLNMSNSLPNPVFGLGCSKNPEDLVRRLHNVEDDYNDDDDDLVNYSLQYRDEHMTPGIRSPRTEEIYEMSSDNNQVLPPSKPFIGSQIGGSSIPTGPLNGPTTPSDGGLSALSSCVGSTSSGAGLPKENSNNTGLGTQDLPGACLTDRQTSSFSIIPPGNTKYSDPNSMYYVDAFDDEKPTNFGAIYSEEQLYEPIQTETVGMMGYQGMATPDQFPPHVNQNQSPMGEKSEPQVNDDSKGGSEKSEYQQEEDDKFDTGAITPGHYYHHKSGRNSGIMTPRTPMFQDTPLVFSRTSSLESLDSCDEHSIHSCMTSEPGSRMMSGAVSPSQLPDSPSQSMPVSRPRSPQAPHANDQYQTRESETNGRDAKSGSDSHPATESESVVPIQETAIADRDGTPNSRAKMSKAIEDRLEKLDQPDYLASLPQQDETNVFKSECAMSVMTTFSSLTIDSSDKIKPLLNTLDTKEDLVAPDMHQLSNSAQGKDEDAAKEDANKDENQSKDGESPKVDDTSYPCQLAVSNAGYITSLPTNDEIKTFVCEGSFSPMTSFSEISCLKENNEGFQRGPPSNYSIPNSSSSNKMEGSQSVASNKNSFASRSSATGASVPPPAPQNLVKSQEVLPEDSSTSKEKETGADAKANASSLTSPKSLDEKSQQEEDDDDDDIDSLPDSSSDDDDLLQRCIEHGLPKKRSSSQGWSSKSSTKSSSSRSSSKNGKSSRIKEKTKEKVVTRAENPSPTVTDEDAREKEDRSVRNPSPEVVRERVKRINIKEKLNAAEMKLGGRHIVDYIDMIMEKAEDGPTSPSGAQGQILSGAQKSRQVIENVETLEQTYSVKKKMKETEKEMSKSSSVPESSAAVTIPKTTGFLPSEPTPSQQSNFRLQSFIREGMTSYAIEGTPIEMSRSTSLSNLTIESDGPEHKDLPVLQNRLKASLSVPDIKSVNQEVVPGVENSGSAIDVAPRDSDRRTQDLTTTCTDSREILEDLGRQIENLSLTTAEAVLNSPGKFPGYMTSLPHPDEIKKFATEGSQSGLTMFSALTIDSDTKITPAIHLDVPNANNSMAPQNESRPATSINQDSQMDNKPAVASEKNNENPSNHPQSPEPAPYESRVRSFSGHSVEDVSHATTSSSKEEVTVIQNPKHTPRPVTDAGHRPIVNSKTAPDVLHPPQSSHYSENDPISQKEGMMNYKIEDTPLCFSSNSSLSSLDFGSDDDDLLKDCISSALPVDKPSNYAPPPNQLLNLIPPHPSSNPDMLSRYGIPDGKLDSPTGQQMTYIQYANPDQLKLQNLQMRGQTFISDPSSIQSPTEEQWALFQRDADVISAQLLQNTGQFQSAVHNLRKITPSSRPSDSRNDRLPISSSYNSLSQQSDGFCHLTRQQSMPDSDLSANSVQDDHHHYDGTQSRGKSSYEVGQMRKSRSRQERMMGDLKPSAPVKKGSKGGKKYLSPSAGRQRDITSARRGQARESSSGSSSSYRQHRHMSGSTARISSSRNADVCSKCQIPCARTTNQRCVHHNPVSASTSRLVESMTSPTRPRRKSTNSGSKHSARGYEYNPHQHQTRPQRSRLVKNEYLPSVTQLYPPLADMSGVLMGVASVAARGDKVVAERSGAKYSTKPGPPGGKRSSNASSGSTPALVKQGTFITDSPSPVLLEKMTQEERDYYTSKSASSTSSISISPSQTRQVDRASGSKVASPRGSTHSLKSHSVVSASSKDKKKTKVPTAPQAKPKHNKVWNGIKKLLSPSEESKSIDKNAKHPQKDNLRREIVQKGSKSPKNVHGKHNLSTRSQQQPKKPLPPSTINVKKTGESGSSLSLSSSSVSNNSGSESDFGTVGPNPTMTPYGHLPKSPSASAIGGKHLTAIPQSQSTGVLQDAKAGVRSVWRRTPPPGAGSSNPKTDKVYSASSNSLPGENYHQQRNNTSLATSSSNELNQGECRRVWVSKKESTNLKKGSSNYSITSGTKIPLPQGQNQFESSDGCVSEAANGELKPGVNETGLGGFPPPPRTHSPRVIQQVAPFNYNPSPKKPTSPSLIWREKTAPSNGRRISPDCKQTSV